MKNCTTEVNAKCRPSHLNQLQQNSISELWKIVSELESSLNTSHKHEQRLKLALQEQSQKTNHLQELLEKERSRNARLLCVMKGVDSSLESSPRTTTGSSNTTANDQYGLNTISPVLMQYRYDELALSHRRCLKLLCKKERLLKETVAEKEEIQTKLDDLMEQYKTLQKKTEILCCKYFNLQARKTDEALGLRELLTYTLGSLRCNCTKNTEHVDDKILLSHLLQIATEDGRWK